MLNGSCVRWRNGSRGYDQESTINASYANESPHALLMKTLFLVYFQRMSEGAHIYKRMFSYSEIEDIKQ